MSRSSRLRSAVGAVAAIGLSLSLAPLQAQLSAGFSAASFQFNLSNPGARSLAMGGAFSGLADDATAAYANPAGLTVLARPEISFEGRTASFRLPLVAAEPIVSGAIGQDQIDGVVVAEIAAFAGIVDVAPLGAPDASGTTASFASYVYPARDWTFAVYRHQLVDLEAAGGVLLRESVARALDLRVTTSGETQSTALLDMTSFGLAAARRFGPRFSLGVTLVRNRASIEARSTSSFAEEIQLGRFPPETLHHSFDHWLRGDDEDLTVNAGVMVRPGSRTSVGLSYRQGATFDLFEVETTRGPAGDLRREAPATPFVVPDVLAIGASLQATNSLVVSAEWDRVRYSDLRLPSRIPDSLTRFGAANDPGRLSTLGRFEVDDANELRAGVEYAWRRLPGAPTVRLGAWLDPEHRVRFVPRPTCPEEALTTGDGYRCSATVSNTSGPLPDGTSSELERQVFDAAAAAALERLFPTGENLLHFTGGFGLVLGSRFQVDAGFDYVDSDRYVGSLSGVVQF